jgi:hypothetical protein
LSFCFLWSKVLIITIPKFDLNQKVSFVDLTLLNVSCVIPKWDANIPSGTLGNMSFEDFSKKW